MDTPAQPLACSLEGSALVGRMDAWQEVVRRATSRRVERDRVVAIYPNDPDLRDRLHELIAAEAECCGFLRFDLDERPDTIVTELRLPDGMTDSTRSLILELFGRSSVR
jgi:hypothetical protein